MRYANLSGSDLSQTKLVSTELTEANCEHTNFENATGLGERFKQKWNITNAAAAQKVESRSEEPKETKKEKKEKKEKTSE